MTTTVERTLTAIDRCDSCSAQAKVVIILTTGELMFCGHHTTQHKDSLMAKSVSYYDPYNFLV
jgi:hypothetical protein